MSFIPVTVLIIESHPIMREALCSVLIDEPDLRPGMQANTLAEALQMMMTVLPDVILLSLSHTDQVTMVELTALSETLPNVPILVLTSDEEIGQQQIALDLGAQAVLSKAVSRSGLLLHLREISRKVIPGFPALSISRDSDQVGLN